jgi:ribonucleotide monophosphatase NagD (HAD superfamily)
MPNRGYQAGGQPKLFFCNGDFIWATQNPIPRLAQGGFLQALKGIWAHATDGADLLYCMCGKPTAQTYAYGEQALQKLGGDTIKTVYMIGDNTASDIAGANAYQSQCGYEWRSILVETGVYKAGTTPDIAPNHIASNVAEAVEWAFADAAKQTEEQQQTTGSASSSDVGCCC